VVLEVTAKDEKGNVLYNNEKEYLEIGLDIDGYMRYGAWQIKELLDLTLQPLKTQEENYLFILPKNIKEANVAVNVYYKISGKKKDLIYQEVKKFPVVEE